MMRAFLLLILCFSIFPASAEVDDKAGYISLQKKFIKDLYLGKSYFDTIAEARRLQVEENTPELDYFIYMNYYLAAQYKTVILRYNYEESPLGLCAAALVSSSYLKLRMFDAGYKTLSAYSYSGDGERDMKLFLGRAAPLLLSGDLEGLEREELSAEPFLKDHYNFTSLRKELESFRSEGVKSPLKSALMSGMIPGLGQVYSGYPGEGLISFVSVAATALGGVYLHNRGRVGYSRTLFFFSGLFYTGNIYGAYNSAEKRNRSLITEKYRSITDNYGGYDPETCIDIEGLFR